MLSQLYCRVIILYEVTEENVLLVNHYGLFKYGGSFDESEATFEVLYRNNLSQSDLSSVLRYGKRTGCFDIKSGLLLLH
jgi:hypothetical protein